MRAIRWLPVLACYLIALGLYSIPWTGDQKFYISTALEMRDAGAWLLPRFLGETSYFKPPFQYWATLSGFQLFGLNLWGALLPSVIAAFGCAFFLKLLSLMEGLGGARPGVDARRVEPGFPSGLGFLLCLGTLTYGTVAQMEIWVCLFHAAAWWAGVKAVTSGQRMRGRWLLLAFSIAGAAAWVKSPVYSAFWVLGYSGYLIFSGRVENLRDKRLWLALSVGVAMGLSWYVYAYAVDGERFWAEYVVKESLEKKAGNGGSVASIWYALFYFCFPFTLLIGFAIRDLVHERRREFRALFLGWFLPPAIFFSVHPYRVTTYLYILVPVLFLALSRVDRSRFPLWVRATSGIVPALVLSLLAAVLWRAGMVPAWIGIGLIVSGLLHLAILRGPKGYGDQVFLVGAGAALLMVRLAAVSLGMDDLAALRALVAENPDAKMVMLDEGANIWHEAGILSLATGVRIEKARDDRGLALTLAQGGWVLLSEEQLSKLGWTAEVEPAGLTWRAWPRWKGRVKFPFRDLIVRGPSALGPEQELLKRKFWMLHSGR